MTVLVLGATSGIGESLALEFSPGNALALCGRRAGRLNAVAERCRGSGATAVNVVVADLASGAAQLLLELGDRAVDLCINAASATSRLRDGDIDLERLRELIEVDVVGPLELLVALRARRGGRPSRVVLISSVLAGLPSPDRRVYGALKALQETALQQAAARWPELDVRVIRVGRVLATGPASAETAGLARFARRALDGRRRLVTWGTAGRALTALFWLQPLAFTAVMALRRGLTGAAPRPSRDS
jgi:short-subunit dehydrogenase